MTGPATVRYRVRAPQVVADVVDGEAIVVDLASGRYHRLTGAGADVWQALIDGCPPPSAGAAADLVAALLAAELIEPDPGAAGPAEWPAVVEDGSLALESFEDLADMLLLDPIHDADPDLGWPTPSAPA